VNHINQDGVDIDIFLALVQQGNTLILQDANVSGNYQTWLVNGTPVHNATDWTFPISLVTSGGATNFANNHQIILALLTTGPGASTWSQYPATQAVNVNTQALNNTASVSLVSGTNTAVLTTGLGGILYVNDLPIVPGGAVSWSLSPAVSNVNMFGFEITNARYLRLTTAVGGQVSLACALNAEQVPILVVNGANYSPTTWSLYAAKGNIRMGYYAVEWAGSTAFNTNLLVMEDGLLRYGSSDNGGSKPALRQLNETFGDVTLVGGSTAVTVTTSLPNAIEIDVPTLGTPTDTTTTTAWGTANTAVTDAAAAQSTADTALTDAGTATATANAAQGTATTALANAATAQGTADGATAAAAAAQGTADTALAAAATAQGTADTALAAAAAAELTAGSALTAAGVADAAAAAAAATAGTALAQSGVTSVNSGTGAISISAGTNITVGTSGSTITINSTAVPAVAFSYNIYVSNISGNDTTGLGTIVSPYQTIGKAITVANAVADTNQVSIFLAAGTYTENVSITRANTFLSGSATSLSAATIVKGTITIDMTASSLPYIIGGISSFQVTNIVYNNTVANNQSYLITDCLIAPGLGVSAITLTDTSVGGSGDVTIQSCVIYVSDTIAINDSDVYMIFVNTEIKNNPLIIAPVSFIQTTGKGIVVMYGCLLTQNSTSSTVAPIINLANNVTTGAMIIQNSSLVYTSTASDTGTAAKCCIRCANPSTITSISLFNNLLVCQGATTTTGVATQFLVLQRTGAGSVVVVYGQNSGAGTTAYLPLTGSGFTKVAYANVA
jgi:hypothetical protein